MNLFSSNEKSASGSDAKQTEKKIHALEKRIEGLEAELKEFKEAMKKAVTRVETKRYNPFREIGGNQSFSTVFLDGEDNGIVLTSHYGRDANRVYAKPIQRGSSEYTLSEEEQEILQEALRGEKKKGKKK